MVLLKDRIEKYSKLYHKIKNDAVLAKRLAMPGNAYFIDNDEILVMPGNDGECRYPYGTDGFNFWAYASGYMHCNEGLFSPFLKASEGQEPKIAFFAGLPEEGGGFKTVPLLSVPVIDDYKAVERYTIMSKCSAYYFTELDGLRFSIRTFVNQNKNIYYTINIENLTGKPVNMFVSAYFNPFLLHGVSENGENRWFREVRYMKDREDSGLGYFVIKTNEDLSRTVSISNYGVIRRNIEHGKKSKITCHEESASRYQYAGGIRSSLHSPKALENGTFGVPKHVCAFTEIGAAGDIIHLEIGEDDTVRYDIKFDYIVSCRNEEGVKSLLNKKFDIKHVDEDLDAMEALEAEKSSRLQCSFGKTIEGPIRENIFNSFFEHLKKQVEFCSLIKGYVQVSYGSLIGIRDVFQALEGLLIWQPETARKKMMEALNFISPDGRCPRQYSLPSGEGDMPNMDLRAFIDQGIWIIGTIITYLRYTGDFALLDEECGYYEIVDEKRKIVKKSSIKNSVLDHMFRIMDYLIKNRDYDNTLCVRALYGDWNDALDGLGVSLDPNCEYGTGVSVMASLQVFQNLHEMMELLERIDGKKYKSLIMKYGKVADEIEIGLKKHAVIANDRGEKRIIHGWGDKKSYLVGSFDDVDHKSRCGLTSNAFWVLSELYDKDMGIRDTILNTFERLDSKYGLKTFEPYFDANTPGVGRIPKLPPGTAENGATYVHGSAFGIMAMFRMGCPELAWNQLYKSLPFTHDFISCSPYVMPNSYGFNEGLLIDGESMMDWQTGSSNVVLKLLIKYVFGINPQYNGLWIQPAVWIPFQGFKLKITIRSCAVNLFYNSHQSGGRNFTVNGEKRKGIYDDVMRLDKLWISNEELKCGEINICVD